MKHYLHVEAVNLGNFVYDTRDLSTIRGGGLMLLRAVTLLQAAARKELGIELTAVSTGASSGLFEFAKTGKADASKVVHWAREWFGLRRTGDPQEEAHLQHATFVVACVEATADFRRDVESLHALGRRQQMAMPSLAVPPASSADAACSVDLRRPGTRKVPLPGQAEKRPVSEATFARREYGRRQKQAFYLDETRQQRIGDIGACEVASVADGMDFSEDLEQIAAPNAGDDYGNLTNKIAVVYLDGNGFGKMQSACATAGDLGGWDRKIKEYRRGLLSDLLASLKNDDRWVFRHAGKSGLPIDRYRIETLLWGGDEVMWVVPAWQGLWLLEFFFDKTKDWHHQGSLTHSGGIVFCNHKAPIHRVTQLARSLAEQCKAYITSALEPNDTRRDDLFGWVVLESFDHAGTDLDTYLLRRYRGAIPEWRKLIVPGAGFVERRKAAIEIARELPKGRLYRQVGVILEQGHSADHRATVDLTKLKTGLSDVAVEALDTWPWTADKSDPGSWIALLELWDYLTCSPLIDATEEGR